METASAGKKENRYSISCSDVMLSQLWKCHSIVTNETELAHCMNPQIRHTVRTFRYGHWN